MNRSQFVAMVKRDKPEFGDIPDDELPDLIADAMLVPGPGSQRIQAYFRKHDITSGLFLGWLIRRRTAQEADVMKNLLSAAQSANEIDTLLRSSERGIPRDIYSRVVDREEENKGIAQLKVLDFYIAKATKTHETDQSIRFEREKAAIEAKKVAADAITELSAADFTNHDEIRTRQALTAEMFRLIDEIYALKALGWSEARELKINLLEEQLAADRTRFNGRFGN